MSQRTTEMDPIANAAMGTGTGTGLPHPGPRFRPRSGSSGTWVPLPVDQHPEQGSADIIFTAEPNPGQIFVCIQQRIETSDGFETVNFWLEVLMADRWDPTAAGPSRMLTAGERANMDALPPYTWVPPSSRPTRADMALLLAHSSTPQTPGPSQLVGGHDGNDDDDDDDAESSAGPPPMEPSDISEPRTNS